MARFFSILGVILTLNFFLSGCGGPTLAEVTGKVTYKNEPLKQGTITFAPEQGRPANGKIVNGEIVEVTTYKAGDGITVGQYKVTITSLEDPEDMYSTKSLIPEKYGNHRTSDLTADIKPGMNELSFDLK